MNNDSIASIQEPLEEHISYIPEYMSAEQDRENQSERNTENVLALQLSKKETIFQSPRHLIQATILLSLIVIAGVIGTIVINKNISRQPIQTNAATSVANAGATKGFTTIHNADMGISMEYPATWTPDTAQTLTAGNGIGFGISTGTEYAHIVILQIAPNLSTTLGSIDNVNTQVFQYFQTLQGTSNFQTVQPASAMLTIASVQWKSAEATFTDTNGATYHLTTLAVLHDTQYYNIYYVVLARNYAQTTSQYIQPMLHSFMFNA